MVWLDINLATNHNCYLPLVSSLYYIARGIYDIFGVLVLKSGSKHITIIAG